MENLIKSFYEAFNRLDAEDMVSLYDNEVIFEDPAFGILRGEHAKNMWRMLCASQKESEFKVIVSDIEINDHEGRARWDAYYTFSKTGRKVHNIVSASFVFEDGKIIKHTDHFDLYRWSQQALGFKGFLFGWARIFKKQLNKQTNQLLNKFENKPK